jgi:hypothetical protein
MPRWSLKRPERPEFEEVLSRVVSITALAQYYRVPFTTAKKWIGEFGLEPAVKSKDHLIRLSQITEEATKRARKARIDGELNETLGDIGDRKLLARAIVDEFSMRYIFKKCYSWERFVLKLTLVMYDLPPVEEVARLAGVPFRMRFRKAKNGFGVPYWWVGIEGYRAFRILQLARPYLTGQKAFQADIALRAGGVSSVRVPLQKAIYKRNLLASVGVNADYWLN